MNNKMKAKNAARRKQSRIPVKPLAGAVTHGTIASLLSGHEIVGVTVAAEELDITTRQVQYLCARGRLGSFISGYYLITRHELNAFKKIPRNVGRPRKDASLN